MDFVHEILIKVLISSKLTILHGGHSWRNRHHPSGEPLWPDLRAIQRLQIPLLAPLLALLTSSLITRPIEASAEASDSKPENQTREYVKFRPWKGILAGAQPRRQRC